MEARKILFVMNNSSSQKSIMSGAETLGALKADMRRAGINYDNMTFYEGRTRTELKDDASVLPTNIPVAAKGTTPATTTNDLVFMLTTANKKIRVALVIDLLLMLRLSSLDCRMLVRLSMVRTLPSAVLLIWRH